MRVEPIQPNQPSMGMRYHRKVYNYSDIAKNVKDYIKLDNGKEVEIHSVIINDKLSSKLEYLKNELGEWVRSRLVLYNHKGKRSVIKLSERVKKYNED